MAALLRTWPALAAWGAGLVHLAIGAGTDAATAAVLIAIGAVELAWGILSMREGRVVAPRATLGIALAVLAADLVWAVSPSGRGMPLPALAAASVFVLFVAGACAVTMRASGDSAQKPGTSGAEPRRARAVVGLVLGAVLVAGVATPALAATEAGKLARPHGEHGTVIPDLPEAPGHHH